MKQFFLESSLRTPVGEGSIEVVERKGLGHPDSICDAVMESVSVALCQAYMDSVGQVLHYNLDKGLLVAGHTSPDFGGGRVMVPMRMMLGDRATTEYPGGRIPLDDIVKSSAKRWVAEHLRFVDPEKHIFFQNDIQPGSTELVDIFNRDEVVANDTSAAVGYAPLTETERLVLEAERWLNSKPIKERFPAAGEDVKVMAVRQDRWLHLTVALAFVDRCVRDAANYFELKDNIATELKHHLEAELTLLDGVDIHLNTLDQSDRGLGGMYLTVLGTSAESGDSGEVGRGNAANGVISLMRPTSNEAAAGKNAVSHVGKIYNLLSFHIAQRVYESIEPVEEVYVWLCSQIGRRLDQPWFASASVVLQPEVGLADVRRPIEEIVSDELENIASFSERLLRGAMMVC